MVREILYLKAKDNRPESRTIAADRPVWSLIETCVDHVFIFGGYVFLFKATIGNDDKLQFGTFLAIDSLPGEFRLTYTIETQPNEKAIRHEWWEPGDGPFRGTTVFNDHSWDDRTVCRDDSVALKMFRDFFDHGDLTQVSRSELRSTADRKPR